MKNVFGFNKYFKTIVDTLFNVFLILVLLSSLYVCCYLLKGTIKLIAFALLILCAISLLIFKKKQIRIIQELIIDNLKKKSDKKLLLIIVLSIIVLKIFYTIFFYFDPTITTVIISKYVGYAEDFVNEGTLKITIGDNYYFLAILLSLFPRLHIPYHIGMFIILLFSMIINFLSFKDIIGKEKAFIGIMLYVLMPSTMLLTFCPTVEIYLIFLISIYFCFYIKLYKNKSILYSFILVVICFLVTKLSFIGYILIVILFLSILFNQSNKKISLIITITLLLSVSLNNLYKYSFSYEWRNKERLYETLIYGSKYESSGRYVEGYFNEISKVFIPNDHYDYHHMVQEIKYKNELINNFNNLLNNPKKILELLSHKFMISFSGNHYSIEMLNNTNNISNILFYLLLGINESMYLVIIWTSLANLSNKDYSDLTIIKILILLSSLVLLLIETNNRFSIYITPFLYLLCMNKVKQE